jgi:hypothetical protein
MLPSQAGKSRYRDGSGSPMRWLSGAENIASQQFGQAVVPVISSRQKCASTRGRFKRRECVAWDVAHEVTGVDRFRPGPEQETGRIWAQPANQQQVVVGSRPIGLARLVSTRRRVNEPIWVFSGAAGSTKYGCWARVRFRRHAAPFHTGRMC